MASEVLEIVRLENGGVALRRVDEVDAEPVMEVKFSEDTLTALEDQHMQVAQGMIAAGIQLMVEAKQRIEDQKQEAERPSIIH